MGRYTSARSFDDRSTEVQAAPTEAEKQAAGKKDVLEVQNTMGSTAGAGSGDFHQYRQSRRRENFRMERIMSEAKKDAENEEFQKRKHERETQVEEAHRKRAEKRNKKKAKKKAKVGDGAGGRAAGGGGGADGGSSDSDDDSKRECAGGGADGSGMVGPSLPGNLPGPDVYVRGAADEPPPGFKVKELDNIRVIDDD